MLGGPCLSVLGPRAPLMPLGGSETVDAFPRCAAADQKAGPVAAPEDGRGLSGREGEFPSWGGGAGWSVLPVSTLLKRSIWALLSVLPAGPLLREAWAPALLVAAPVTSSTFGAVAPSLPSSPRPCPRGHSRWEKAGAAEEHPPSRAGSAEGWRRRPAGRGGCPLAGLLGCQALGGPCGRYAENPLFRRLLRRPGHHP